MPWVKLDDQFPDHTKVIGLSDQAFRLHVTALCYCSAQLTDGRVTPLLTRRLTWFVTDSNAVTNELVTAGLWERDGEDYIIHDYLEYNPSAEQVKNARKANASRQKRHRNAVTNAKRNALVTASPSPSPMIDRGAAADRRKQAIETLQQFGLFTATMLAQFDDLWRELVQSEREGWVDLAAQVAKGKNASTPSYALKVLANSLHTGKEPGYVNGHSQDADTRPRVPSPSKEEVAAADARQAAYERQIAEELARAGRLQ